MIFPAFPICPPHGIISTAGLVGALCWRGPLLAFDFSHPWWHRDFHWKSWPLGPRPQRDPISLTSLWWAVCVAWWPGRMVYPLKKKWGVWLENASPFSFNWKSWQLPLACIQMIPQACSQTWQHHVQHLLYQVWKVPNIAQWWVLFCRGADRLTRTFQLRPGWWHSAGYSDGIPWLP